MLSKKKSFDDERKFILDMIKTGKSGKIPPSAATPTPTPSVPVRKATNHTPEV